MSRRKPLVILGVIMDETRIDWSPRSAGSEPSLSWSKLSKKERRELIKEQKRQKQETQIKRANIKKWVIVGSVVVLVVFGIVWMVGESSKPLPGKEVSVLGRSHVSVGKKVKYNSNPPTSGDHYADWTKSGVYDKPIEDGHLVHSLEHGYVIISHNCEITTKNIELRTQNSGTESAEMDKSCLDFVKNLKERVKKDAWKLILVPRKDLDTNFALTAWGRIDKFNIQESSMDRVNSFIRALRNNGPEKTME